MVNITQDNLSSRQTTPNSVYLKDKIFKELVKSISPNKTWSENEKVLEGFVDILGNLSPISLNISDVFYKYKKTYDPIMNNSDTNHIKNVQNTMNQTFVNNFWSTYNKYSKDYLIWQKIQEMLIIYEGVPGQSVDRNMNFGFFENYQSMFTEDKYIANREFKVRKGTKTAMEFAYKSIWKAKAEGIFRENYYFEFNDTYQAVDIKIGSCVNPDPPVCTDPGTCDCTQPGRLVGTFLVSGNPDWGNTTTEKTPFTYQIIGSMLPIFFNTMVRDLAHPVGFGVKYKREFDTFWEDTFNIFVPISSDAVYVKSLCYDGDCTNPNDDYYWNKYGDSITKSPLIQIFKEELHYDQYRGFELTKYLFKNESFLLEYSSKSITGDDKKNIIKYYDNTFLLENLVNVNNEFDNAGDDWNATSRWSFSNGQAILDNTTSDPTVLSQEINFIEMDYVVEINIINLDGSLKMLLGDINKVNPYKELIITSSGKHTLRLSNFVNFIGEILLQESKIQSTATIESISVYKDIPAKTYLENTHSAVIVDNLKTLNPELETKDELINWNYDFHFEDLLNDMSLISSMKYPIVGSGLVIGQSVLDENILFRIGCYRPEDWSPENNYGYDSPEACCEANKPYNPPGQCHFGEIFFNNTHIRYMMDSSIIFELLGLGMEKDIIIENFDNWTLISGDADLSNGIITQGSVTSIFEIESTKCKDNSNLLFAEFEEIIPSNSPGRLNIFLKYIGNDNNEYVSILYNEGNNQGLQYWSNDSCNGNKGKFQIEISEALDINEPHQFQKIKIFKDL